MPLCRASASDLSHGLGQKRPLREFLRPARQRPLLADQRPLWPPTGRAALYLSLLGHLQSIVDFDAEVPDSAFQLGVPE